MALWYFQNIFGFSLSDASIFARYNLCLALIVIIIIIVCLIKTSSGSQKTELHDVKCYKVINSKKILYYNAI
jgi:hypothetical protein